MKQGLWTVEGVPCVEVGELYGQSTVLAGGVVTKWWGEWPNAVGLALRAGETAVEWLARFGDGEGGEEMVESAVEVVWSRQHLGGWRAWFVCPEGGCGRTTGRLFFHRGALVCRSCAGLVYASSRQRRSARARRLDRIRAIRERLGGPPAPFAPFPDRPKGMHVVSYDRLCLELAELEALEESLPPPPAEEPPQLMPREVVLASLAKALAARAEARRAQAREAE